VAARADPTRAAQGERGLSRAALALGSAMMLIGLGLYTYVSLLLALVGAGYVALTLSYTVFWRQIAILDVVAIAGGFVLRAPAGGVAAPITLGVHAAS
jgi:decaprenyl-phosphate phosphoribosyltransferase